MDWSKLDKITVEQMRTRLESVLEGKIKELANIIRKGYHSRYEAEAFLQNEIGETLTQIDNLRSQAGLINLFK